MIEKYIGLELSCHALFQEGVKVASFEPDVHVPPEIEAFVQNLEPDPKYAYMHTIAMSDGDAYGSNMNGDVFEWDELTGLQGPDEAIKNPGDARGICVPRFKTFEHAKFFKHHANSPTDPHYGDVPLAVINLPMRRIELIIRVAREDIRDPSTGRVQMYGAPEIANKLDGGGVVAVSMGCRIGNEKCTYCNAENEFVSQRCPHMARRMGEIMPNGVKVAALNYKPRFFDISKVTIPADPIALSLSKVAEYHSPANKLTNTARDVKKAEAWRRKWAEIVKEIPADSVGERAEELDEDCEKCKHSEFNTQELREAFDMARGDLNDVVSTATIVGVVFSPDEMAKLASFASPQDTDDIVGFDTVRLDNFNYSVYDALRSKIASRSGFVAGMPEADWDPIKIAEAGHPEVSDYYAFYRTCLSSLSSDTFTKAAHVVPPARELLGDVTERSPRLTAALRYLAFAGISA